MNLLKPENSITLLHLLWAAAITYLVSSLKQSTSWFPGFGLVGGCLSCVLGGTWVDEKENSEQLPLRPLRLGGGTDGGEVPTNVSMWSESNKSPFSSFNVAPTPGISKPALLSTTSNRTELWISPLQTDIIDRNGIYICKSCIYATDINKI